MKSTSGIFLLAMLTAAASSFAEPEPAKTAPTLAPIGFLAGAWRGDLPASPDGRKMSIETHFEWAANHQALRFDSAWVVNGKRAPYSSGLYAYDPEKKQLQIVYTDAEGALTTGGVKVTGNVFQHDLRVASADGSADSVRALLTRVDDKNFTNEIDLMKDGAWTKLVEVHYVRAD